MTIKSKRRKAFKEGRGYTRRDWDAVSGNPEWTEKNIKKAKPFAKAFPDLAESIKRARTSSHRIPEGGRHATPRSLDAFQIPVDRQGLARQDGKGTGAGEGLKTVN